VTVFGLLLLIPARPGRRLRVVIRTVVLPVFGLGGLALGALLTLIAFPSVPFDDTALVVTSVAVPVALGAFLAADRAGRAGLAGAAAGALLGAWLGCGAAPLGLLTAVIGAVAGANLVLIASPKRARRLQT
jgi:hypothetical protein